MTDRSAETSDDDGQMAEDGLRVVEGHLRVKVRQVVEGARRPEGRAAAR